MRGERSDLPGVLGQQAPAVVPECSVSRVERVDDLARRMREAMKVGGNLGIAIDLNDYRVLADLALPVEPDRFLACEGCEELRPEAGMKQDCEGVPLCDGCLASLEAQDV